MEESVHEKDKKDKDEKVLLSKEEHAKLLDQIKEFEATREKLLRSAADYDNARKRLAKEREEWIRFNQERMLRDLLPTLDNFGRALTHSESAPQTLGAGMQLIWKEFQQVLFSYGLKRFPSEGEPFDPHRHEAVDQVEEEGPEGIVVKEIASGYLFHDRVLRPAKVCIRVSPHAKAKPPEEKEEEIT